jgi:pSer/pThr/pTyr-binding forkhead associated (FHA) protein
MDGDPRVFQVEKRAESGNAFPLGVTIGRVDSNDLVLADDSVSRFHAFLRFDERDRVWVLTDAESKNGTWVDELKVEPNQSAPLKDGSKLRFGDATLQFFLPPSFVKYLEAHGAR